MPQYTFKNRETDEVKTIIMTFDEREAFLAENPEWVQKLTAPLLVSQVGSTLSKTDDGWKETLKKIQRGSGKGNTINV